MKLQYENVMIYHLKEAERMPIESKKAVGYARVSTQEQASHGVSLEAQRDRIHAYGQMAGLELVDIISDQGISGSVPLMEREGGHRLSGLISKRNSMVTHVVALKLDRCFRDACDALEQTRMWDKEGITLHLIDMGGQTLSSSGAVGRMFLTMLAAFAELERNLIAERTASAMQHKKRNRAVYNHTPLGFTRQAGLLIEDPAEMETIARIRDMLREGTTLARIATILNETNTPTKRGGNWYASTVRQILNNDIYAQE
jgi:DNA invertase Pin-like site-specific DNA recombinase